MSPLNVAQGHPYLAVFSAVGLVLEQKATQSVLDSIVQQGDLLPWHTVFGCEICWAFKYSVMQPARGSCHIGSFRYLGQLLAVTTIL